MERLRRRALAALALALSLSAGSGAVPIDNGVETRDAELPQVVELDMPKGMCSGTIVGPNTVLTAAHCVDPSSPDDPQTTISVSGDQDYSASASFIHPDYHDVELLGQERSDLAVLKIAPPARFKSWLRVRVHKDESDFAATTVTLAGFGRNDHTASLLTGSGTKRQGSNQIAAVLPGLFVTAGLAHDRVYRFFGLKHQADGRDVGLDHGDSGGPMLAGGELIAVNVSIMDDPDDIAAVEQGFGVDIQRRLALMTKDGNGTLGFSASLSDPKNVEFLKAAQRLGYDIDWTQDPPAASVAGALAPKSPTLQGLTKRGGDALGP